MLPVGRNNRRVLERLHAHNNDATPRNICCVHPSAPFQERFTVKDNQLAVMYQLTYLSTLCTAHTYVSKCKTARLQMIDPPAGYLEVCIQLLKRAEDPRHLINLANEQIVS